ncbi:MAG: hypothetical protein D6711_03330 [Chloroflexi bacterium]|nr:MAG: hypothetical protein D6711_03330 [Chloroflexota bacterium]
MKGLNKLLSDDLTLAVGDVHISTGQSLARGEWLGRAIREINPKRIVFIGDMMTFDCLSEWDKDKRKLMEGRRYQREIDAGRRFLDMMYTASKGWNSPEGFILTEGNHEYRLWRYLDKDPTFDGAVDYVSDLGINEWKIIPYKEYYNYKGVDFTHIPINEAGNPVGGKYVSFKVLENAVKTTVFGHTHKLQVAGLHRHGSPHLVQAINIGCYFEHIDDYALGSVTSYWRGIVVLDHYERGSINFVPIRLSALKRLATKKIKR